MNFETEQSARVLTTEAIVGAKKFAAGLGKHGKFNVNQISEKEVRVYRYGFNILLQSLQEWQKELEEMKKSMDKQ